MEYKAGQEYKMKYIDKDQKEHEATYTPDKDTNIAGMINGFKDKTKDFFKLLSIDNKSLDESRKIIEEDTEFYTDEALKVLDYIQNEMTNAQRKKLFKDECGDFESDNEADQLEEFWDWIELLDSDDIEELGDKLNIIEEPEYQSDKEQDTRKITEEKDFGLKDALDNDVELFDDIYLYLDEYIEDEDTKSEIEDIIDKYTGIGGSAEDLDEDSEEYKSELKDCINEIEDLLNLNESKKITESEDKSDKEDKVKNLKLINQAAHSFNDEDLIDVWLTNGVPDGATEEDFEEIVNDTDSTYGTDYSSMIKLFTNLVKKAVEDKDSKYTFFECPEEAFNFVKNSINNNVTNVTRKELIGESKKITESEDKPELADMLIEINRYYIDYIDNISFFIDLANVAGIDYDKVYDWYKSIKEDENDDLEESKKITESDGENDNRIIYVGYAEKAYWKGTLKDYMKDEGNIDSDIIAKAKEDGYDISAHDIEHYDKDPHKDSQKSNLEVTNIRLSGQTEGLVAKATVKTDIGNIELNLLKLDGNYKCVINGFEPTEDEKSIINKYGQEALTKAVVDVYNDKSTIKD